MAGLCWRPWVRCRQVLIGVWSSRVDGTVSESGRFTTARLREWVSRRSLNVCYARGQPPGAASVQCGRGRPWAGRAGSSHLLGVARAVPGCTSRAVECCAASRPLHTATGPDISFTGFPASYGGRRRAGSRGLPVASFPFGIHVRPTVEEKGAQLSAAPRRGVYVRRYTFSGDFALCCPTQQPSEEAAPLRTRGRRRTRGLQKEYTTLCFRSQQPRQEAFSDPCPWPSRQTHGREEGCTLLCCQTQQQHRDKNGKRKMGGGRGVAAKSFRCGRRADVVAAVVVWAGRGVGGRVDARLRSVRNAGKKRTGLFSGMRVLVSAKAAEKNGRMQRKTPSLQPFSSSSSSHPSSKG